MNYPSRNHTIGIATACMNREENLLRVLPNWINSGVDKIHIIDWSSDIHIQEYIENKLEINNKVKFFRINNKSKWVLTHAFNIALSSLDTDFIAKFDCDHLCQNDIFMEIDLKEGNFYRFNFNNNKKGTNGAFISDKNLLEKVNFFDERIDTYGWDESDLFDRVQSFASSIIFLNPDLIDHLPHTSERRIQNQSLELEKRISNYININPFEFNNKYNFFKKALSDDWSLNSKSGFIVREKDLFDNKEFLQKEYFDDRTLNLALLLTIEFFQNTRYGNIKAIESPKSIIKKILKELIKEDLEKNYLFQRDLINIIKIFDNIDDFPNKIICINELENLFINSSVSTNLKNLRIDFIKILNNYLSF